MSSREINIVICGDGDTGKTCVLDTYENKTFNKEHVPTVYDTKKLPLTLEGKEYILRLHDTAGQEEYGFIVNEVAKKADAFILCYSVTFKTSYDNIRLKWHKELQNISKTTPIILVATKSDLRNTENSSNMIQYIQGEKLKKQINAVAYFECSSLLNINIKEIIEEAVRQVDEEKFPKKKVNACEKIFCWWR